MHRVKTRFRNIYTNIYYSFPVQLFVLQLKKHLLLLFFWMILFIITLQLFGKKFGVPYLFLDPEYLGSVDFWSFFVLGFFWGVFAMMWNIASYILNGYRFPFLATLSRPFFKYTINNFILPLIFLIVYCFSIIQFQLQNELQTFSYACWNLSGFALGALIINILTITYFFNTNKDIFKMFGLEFSDQENKLQKHRKVVMKKNLKWEDVNKKSEKTWRVDTYLSVGHFPAIFKLHLVRSTEHYDPEILKSVFRQNHRNALLVQLFAFVTLLIISLFGDYGIFQIPAGASILLLLAIIMMFIGALSFWLRGWRTSVLLIIVIGLNYVISKGVFNFTKKAYGLDYSGKFAEYSYDKLTEFTHKGIIKKDIDNTLDILSKRRKQLIKKYGNKKPKLILITASGGGLRSAVWTMRTLQYVDSLTNGKLMDHTAIISGASAGIIASSYFRELCLQDKLNKIKNPYNMEYLYNITQDILNPITFSMLVNDMFLPIQKFNDGKFTYLKDRGYAFEQQLNKNTDFVLDKRLKDYIKPEKDALIPMMVITPTVLNDGRKLLISSQPVSYLTSAAGSIENFGNDIDAVEFTKLFEKQQAFNIRFTTALRMSATFPYITPTISLPSEPLMDVMDAGIRDNFGTETAIRFISVFRDWISENTGGVIIVQIRDTEKSAPVEEKKSESLIDKLFNPLSGFTNNWAKFQDYNHDNLILSVNSWLNGSIDVVRFQYIPTNIHDKAALSWHLTTNEKQQIIRSIYRYENQKALIRLKDLLGKQSNESTLSDNTDGKL